MQDIILSSAQKSLLRLLQTAGKKSWYLAGGTAIALHIGHRKSIDFDLFKREKFRSAEIDNLLASTGLHWSQKFVQSTEEQTGIIGGVKVTFFTYPFDIAPECEVIFGIHTPTLLTL